MNATHLTLPDSAVQMSLTPELELKLKAFIRQTLQASFCTCSSQAMELLDRAWQVQRLLWQLRLSSGESSVHY